MTFWYTLNAGHAGLKIMLAYVFATRCRMIGGKLQALICGPTPVLNFNIPPFLMSLPF